MRTEHKGLIGCEENYRKVNVMNALELSVRNASDWEPPPEGTAKRNFAAS